MLEFLKAVRKYLDISSENFLLYLEEISSTLSGYCYKFSTAGRTAKELCHANYQSIEMAMSEGHPIFVANNGRLGFDVNDFNSYAPEVGGSLHLSWLAVSRNRAVFPVLTKWIISD